MFKHRVEEIISNDNMTILRKFQLSALEILLEVDKICKENDITYWIDWGTLLGAVRHQGFIPWDDDLDISMPRADYEKFRTILENKALPNEIVYEDKYTDTWYQTEMNVKPSFLKLYYLDHFTGYDHHESVNWKGAFIDIFPMDDVNEKMCTNKLNIVNRIVSRRVMKNPKGISNNIKAQLSKLNLEKLWIKKCKKMKLNNKADFLVCGIETPFMDIEYIQKKSDIYPIKEISFEGYTLPCPNNSHNYLTKLYGNYMAIPKKEDRHTHLSDLKL